MRSSSGASLSSRRRSRSSTRPASHLDPQLLRLRLGLEAAQRLARRPAAGKLPLHADRPSGPLHFRLLQAVSGNLWLAQALLSMLVNACLRSCTI